MLDKHRNRVSSPKFMIACTLGFFRCIPILGEIHKEKAKFYKQIMKKDDFQASVGRWDKFKRRFVIRLLTLTYENCHVMLLCLNHRKKSSRTLLKKWTYALTKSIILMRVVVLAILIKTDICSQC